MPEYLESAPKSWKCRLVLAAVPRDGAPYEDEFTLPFDRAVKESQVEGLLLQQLPGLLAVVGRYGQVAAGVQFKTEPGTEGQVIFQHQDVCHGGTSLGVLSYGGIISRFW